MLGVMDGQFYCVAASVDIPTEDGFCGCSCSITLTQLGYRDGLFAINMVGGHVGLKNAADVVHCQPSHDGLCPFSLCQLNDVIDINIHIG